MSDVTCAICTQPVPKYKCRICKAPSCSLKCFKSHEEACMEHISHHETNEKSAPTHASEALNPTHGQRQADQLNALFAQFPKLKEQLRTIYESTLKPSNGERTDRQFPRGRGGRYKDRRHEPRQWTPETGFDTGLDALRATVERKDTGSEAIEAFIKLITTADTKPTGQT